MTMLLVSLPRCFGFYRAFLLYPPVVGSIPGPCRNPNTNQEVLSLKEISSRCFHRVWKNNLGITCDSAGFFIFDTLHVGFKRMTFEVPIR